MAFTKSSCGLYLPNSADRAVIRVGLVSFWAENGMVCISKELDGGKEEFTQLAPSSARHRVEALIDMARRKDEIGGHDRESRKFFTDFIEGYKRVIRRAEEQGPYEDPSSRRDRVRRRPKTVAVGGGVKT